MSRSSRHHRARQLSLVILTIVSIPLAGCLRRSPKARPVEKPATSATPQSVSDRSSQISSALQELRKQPPLEIDDPPLLSANTFRHTLSTGSGLICDGTREELLGDRSAGLVWILRTGGIADHIQDLSGPWSTDSEAFQRLESAINSTEHSAADEPTVPGYANKQQSPD